MSLLALIAAAALAGKHLLRGIYWRQDAEVWVLRMLAGLGVCALLSFGIGQVSLDAAMAAIYALATIVLVIELGQWFTPARPADTAIAWARPQAFESLCWLAAAAGVGMALVQAFTPVSGYEAEVAHLALPQEYAAAGQLFPDLGNAHADAPHLLYALYAVMFEAGGESYVRLLSWIFLILACGATWIIGLRVGGAQAGALAAALLATTPAALSQVAGVDLDMPFTAFYLGGIAAVFGWHRERLWSWLGLAAFLAGSACGLRGFGYVLLPLSLLLVILPSQGQTLRASLVFCGGALLAAAPWLAWTFFAARQLGEPLTLAVLLRGGSALPVETAVWPGWIDFLKFPWDIVMRPQDFDGWRESPGGLVLALGLPGVILGGPLCWVIGAYSMLGGMGAFFVERSAQFFLPLFAPLFALAGTAPGLVGRLRAPVLGLVLVSLGFGLSLQALLLREALDQPRPPRFEAYARANDFFNTGATVLTLDPRSYYLSSPAWSRMEALEPLAQWPREQQIAWLRDQGIGYLFLPLDVLREGERPPERDLNENLRHMIEAWRNDPAFVLSGAVTMPRAGGEGVERVELYVLDMR